VAIISSNTIMAAGNAETGKAKAATCLACHGPDGNSIAPNFPNLAGQGEAYMKKQLIAFKAGERKDATMNAMSMALDEQAMEDISAFYTTQKLKPGLADPKQVDAGKKIYKGGIMETNVPAFPAAIIVLELIIATAERVVIINFFIIILASYLTLLSINLIICLICSSVYWLPPLGGIAPLPVITVWLRDSIPLETLASQAALSPNLGAFTRPVSWHA